MDLVRLAPGAGAALEWLIGGISEEGTESHRSTFA